MVDRCGIVASHRELYKWVKGGRWSVPEPAGEYIGLATDIFPF